MRDVTQHNLRWKLEQKLSWDAGEKRTNARVMELIDERKRAIAQLRAQIEIEEQALQQLRAVLDQSVKARARKNS